MPDSWKSLKVLTSLTLAHNAIESPFSEVVSSMAALESIDMSDMNARCCRVRAPVVCTHICVWWQVLQPAHIADKTLN